jgi:formate dehydrogenase family accessory protein FdhD
MDESHLSKFIKYSANTFRLVEEGIIVEKPVSLTVNGEVWLTFLCTPTDLEALAVGFLFNEGVINSSKEIASLRVCANRENIDVWLDISAKQPENWRRTSGCTGGFTSVREINKIFRSVGENIKTPSEILEMVERLLNKQNIYKKVGGVHTSFLCDQGNSFIMAEDIGRHNTLDKIAGCYLLKNCNYKNKIVITTGRISSDMLQKAARIGASILISRTSPSSLSIELAKKWGVTLIGYARKNRFNIYTHPNRIVQISPQEASHVPKCNQV